MKLILTVGARLSLAVLILPFGAARADQVESAHQATTKCDEKNYQAVTDCKAALADLEKKSEELQKEAKEKLAGGNVSNSEKQELASKMRAAAAEIDAQKSKCKTKADDTARECRDATKKIISAVLENKDKESLAASAAAEDTSGGTTAQNVAAIRAANARLNQFQQLVNTNSGNAEKINTQTVQNLQTHADNLRATADQLETSTGRTSASPQDDGGGSTTSKAKTDEGGSGGSELNTEKAAQGVSDGMKSGGGAPSTGQTAQNPSAAAMSSSPAAPMAANLPVAAATNGNPATAPGTAEAEGSPSPAEIAASTTSTTTPSSSRGGGLPELAQLPPSAASEAGHHGAGAGEGTPFGTGTARSAAASAAKTEKNGIAKPAVLAGGGGGGGSSGSSWWSYLKNSTFPDLFGRQDFGGGGSPKKSDAANVDLSAFLPQQKPGVTALQAFGIHGPNVDFFSKVNERYHSLKTSLDP